MKKLLLFTVFLLTTLLSAQSIKVRGTIKDSIGDPLELANVIATVKESGAIESYGITNYEGRFQLDLPVNNTYILRASFLGYETSEIEIMVPENASDLQQNFTLNSKAAELDGVEIVYEMPVTVRGDTIIYNADSFTNGTERKLGDVMKKLPGVEINEDGEIEVEGKTVTKVMVEGKDFFDGDSKLATKNIPADAVDKIEVLRNYNEVDQMRGLGNDQDNIAINIKLKDGKKNFWFGEVTAGGGVADEDSRYLVHPKLFYYSPKYSLNFITDFNNIGEVPFTFRDYFKFTGGFRNFNRGGGTNFNVSQSDLGFALTQNNKAKEIEAKFFAGNFSWEASDALDISGFAILSDNKTDIVTNSIRNFVTSNATETTNNISDQRTQLGMLKLSAVYKPNVNFQLDYDALYKTSKQTENNQTLSLVNEIENNIDEEKENRPSSINQNVNVYYTLNDNNIFAGQVQHLYQDEDPFYNAVLDLLPFSGIIPVDQDQNRFDINQEKNIQTNKLDAKVDYYYVINNKSNINFTLGTTLSKQNFNSNMFQLLDNNEQIDFDDALPDSNGDVYSLINDVTYNFLDLFLGVHYKFKTGKFTFTPGVTLHNYILKNEQSGTTITQNDWNVLPDLNILLQFKKSESLRFNYSISQDYTDVNNYAEAYVFSDYNRMFRGNRNLENSLSHNYNLTYFSFNMFNYTNFNGSINYSRRIESVKFNSVLVGINQVSTPINMDSNFPDETFSGFGQFSKRIKKFQLNTSARVSYSTTFNNINTNITESTSFTQNYKASVRTNFRDWPNFEVGYSAIINDYDNGGLAQTFYTHSPFANVDVRFLKHFTFTADWNFYNYSDKDNTIENQYSFLDANLYFQKGDSPWEFKIQATNILATKFTNSDSFNDQFNTTTQYFVLPRIVMFVVKYDL
ncbi:MAG: carboxypeptidase-like regulatory domain-containing protein [Flavobacteriaceae bacterium]|nr:carboxypeptidase-like regulatory domain-containing protein [Flavobacteriaceae bacterium]